MPNISAVIVAGGSSSRMGGVDKLFLRIGSRTAIERSVDVFQAHMLVNEIIVVTSEQNLARVRQLCAEYDKVKAVVLGGAHRNASVQAGIAACSPDVQYYAIHDAARPLVSAQLITDVIYAAIEYGAAAPGTPLTDTIKQVDAQNTIVHTPDRSTLFAVTTPQVFEATLYRAAAKGQGEVFDDCQLLENVGRKVKIVPNAAHNIKITAPGDIALARYIAGEQEMRIGHGYDVHRLVAGRRLVLGGVEISHETGLLGHSDADVVTHAIIDAIFGAAGLGDIGKRFPDSDPQYKDASSLELLRDVRQDLLDSGFAVGNIDATIVCQAPKLRPFIDAMCDNIADALGMAKSTVNIKATTEEGLGFTGEQQGIAAHAVVLVFLIKGRN